MSPATDRSNAGYVLINGRSAIFGGAGFGTANGRSQTFHVTGDLTMHGGSTNDADFRATPAFIGGETGGATIVCMSAATSSSTVAKARRAVS